MTRSTGQRRFHFKNVPLTDPAIKPFGQWLPANRTFYADFRRWLKNGGYGEATLAQYGTAVRLALGLLDKPYPQIEPETDLRQVQAYLNQHFTQISTRKSYQRGLAKLEQYLRQRCQHHPVPEPEINWANYLDPLPAWLAEAVQAYLRHRRRAWLPQNSRKLTLGLLSHLTGVLRWLVRNVELTDLADITPALWFDYVDERLAANIQPKTLNRELYDLQNFLSFLAGQGHSVCPRMLKVEELATNEALPRDLPIDQLRPLLAVVQAEASASYIQIRYRGVMDRAWVWLMLYSGLRTGEVRHLCLSDLNLAARRVRIEQTKGLKDRIVYLSPATVEALDAYLAIRSPAATDHLFIYRHQPLNIGYCGARLHTYGQACGVEVTPHQLRHSCATLLLNAGAPILTVQNILGHKHIDTTLGYARLYDGTVAADYYRAMTQIEQRLALAEGPPNPAITPGHLLALVDSLRDGTLNDKQQQTLQVLRTAILAVTELEIDTETEMN